MSYPLDPLSAVEISKVSSIVRKEKSTMKFTFNTITLFEPKKQLMLNWLAGKGAKPEREAKVLVIENDTHNIFEGLINLNKETLTNWHQLHGIQPIIMLEDLLGSEDAIRKDPRVIKECGNLGIPPEDMDKVYCDGWTIGYDERFGTKTRVQQALLFYRRHIDDNQYSLPLDFCPVLNTSTGKVIHIDVPEKRRPIPKDASNYHRAEIEKTFGYRKDLKPLEIVQPEGVSFKMNGNILEWQNFKLHVGFNHREGIVLSNIVYKDKYEGSKERPLFYRISLAEMVVPYGCPEIPHHRKHAFDLGEYGGGMLTNSLSLGCDCKGTIHYLDGVLYNKAGEPVTIKNAICIHEEDDGILFKHVDMRDNSAIITRSRKLVISQIFTAANYEYCIYWILHQDGTIQFEMKLSGILQTYVMAPDEDTKGWGTQVYPGVNAHNHQHVFCMRIDPQIDGVNNTIIQTDAVAGEAPVGSPENLYGNAFYAKKTVLKQTKNGVCDYDGSTARTWDISNTNKLHEYSKNPVSYTLVSRDVPNLLPKPGSLVWKRANFARHVVHVTPYRDHQLYPAGDHVPQTSGDIPVGLEKWIIDMGNESIENTDIVLWHTFGVVHFPAPEDFPVMPREPINVFLRPRNFFLQNPALDVPPSYAKAPSEVNRNSNCECNSGLSDKTSRLAFV